MWCNERKKQMKNPKVNIVLILELQMINKSLNNNYINEGSKYKDVKGENTLRWST